MIDHEIWRIESGGMIAAESCDFRLVVQAPEALGGEARFLVLRRGGTGVPDRLLGSGIRNDVRTAMAAAEQMVERWANVAFLQTALPS